MKNVSNRVKLLMLALLVAASAYGFVAPGTGGGPDPCNYRVRQSVPIPAATSTTNALLVPGSSGRHIHVCQIQGTVAAASTIQFLQNTPGATTGFTQLTGAMTSIPQTDTDTDTVLKLVSGNSLFYTTTGSGAPGVLEYVYENPSSRVLLPTETPWVTATPTQTPTPTPTPT